MLFAGIVANSDGSGGGALVALGALLIVAGIALGIWRTVINSMLDQGRTGYTYGKRKVGIRVVREQDGQPSGVGSCVGRYFLHAAHQPGLLHRLPVAAVGPRRSRRSPTRSSRPS